MSKEDSSEPDISSGEANSKQQETDYRTYRLNRKEWLVYGIEGLLAAAASAYVFYRSWIALALMSPLAVLYPRWKRKDLKAIRDRRLAEEFREGIMTLASALSAGFSPENAMKESESELRLIYGKDAMIVREFEHMNHLTDIHVSLDRAWEDLAVRSGNEDILNFVQILRTSRNNGGDLAAIISDTSDIIGDRIRIREEILTMTSGRRFEQKIMNIIPYAIVIYIEVTSPGYFDLMYTTILGRAVMTACLAVYTAGVMMASGILKIEI